MSTYKNIELRFFLIGDSQVGKKSISKRFKKINSTETVEGNRINMEISDEHMKILKKNVSNKYKSNEEIKENELKRLKNLEATNFTKVLRISNVSLESKFFIISKPTTISHVDAKEIIDELDEYERENRIKFEKVKTEISYYLSIQNFNYFKSKSVKTINVFLFVYDLTRPDTFRNACIYYEGLRKIFQFEKNQYKAIFLGNKMDIKGALTKKENEIIQKHLLTSTHIKSFINEKKSLNENRQRQESVNRSRRQSEEKSQVEMENINNYEISSKNFYSFERLFEKIFIENIFSIGKEEFNIEFIEKFKKDIYLKGTFSKEIRNMNLNNNPFSPSPQEYNTDIYNVESQDDYKFALKHRSFKIFINKTGPVFRNTSKDNNHTSRERNKENRQEIHEEMEEMKKKEELLKELNSMKYGMSMGIRKGTYNFQSVRKIKKIENSNVFSKLLGLCNINMIENSISNQRKEKQSLKNEEKVVKREYKSPSKERFIYNKSLIDDEMMKNNKEIIESIQIKTEKINQLKSVNKLEYQKAITELLNKRHVLSEKVRLNKKNIDTEKEKLSMSLKEGQILNESHSQNKKIVKGYSIVGKPKDLCSFYMNNYSKCFYLIKSDIDMKLSENIKTFPKAERFTTNNKSNNEEQTKALNEIEEKAKTILKNKLELKKEEKEERIRKQKEGFYGKIDYETFIENKKLKDLSPGVGKYEPDYYQWGKVQPMYSMGMKVNNIKKSDDQMRMMNFENRLKFLSNSIENQKNIVETNFDVVKFSSPKFSFSKAENRFKQGLGGNYNTRQDERNENNSKYNVSQKGKNVF